MKEHGEDICGYKYCKGDMCKEMVIESNEFILDKYDCDSKGIVLKGLYNIVKDWPNTNIRTTDDVSNLIRKELKTDKFFSVSVNKQALTTKSTDNEGNDVEIFLAPSEVYQYQLGIHINEPQPPWIKVKQVNQNIYLVKITRKSNHALINEGDSNE